VSHLFPNTPCPTSRRYQAQPTQPPDGATRARGQPGKQSAGMVSRRMLIQREQQLGVIVSLQTHTLTHSRTHGKTCTNMFTSYSSTREPACSRRKSTREACG
jgi:hypothetical protein